MSVAAYSGRRMATAARDPDLEALRAGDERAFEALTQRHHGAMLRLAMSYVGDRAVAEEVVQETWIAVLQSLDRFEGRSSLATWIFRILVNVARSRHRKESRSLPFSSLFQRDGSGEIVDPDRFDGAGMWSRPPAGWDGLPEERLLSGETRDEIEGALRGLPPKLREVIVLRDVAGWSGEEVSRFLDISPANQRVRLHRARAAVRRALEEYLR